ncbi:MAG TPA: response regulator transcription factor [Chloroflexia bacterium]|nr:response regulator transcription factor [Chloroflexia bacterium]
MITTLIIVDDQPSITHAIKECLAFEPSLQVIGEATNGASALALVRALHPDILLTDIQMPDMDGFSVATQLRESHPAVSVVILTVHDNTANRARAKAMGVSAFVAKHEPAEALLAALRRVATSKLEQV